MPTILSVTAAKTRADSPLGFSYKCEPEGIFITNVSNDGLFRQTHLKAGQQIISINGTGVKTMDTNTFKAVLASLPAGDVTIVIRTQEEHHICSVTFNCECKVLAGQDGSIRRMIRSKMHTGVDIMPLTLLRAGVPRDVWLLIYALIEEELMPVSLACFREKESYAKEMSEFWKGSGKASVQKTANMKGVHTGILHNNVTLVATALKDRVNSILAKYNIMSAIATKEFELPKYSKQTSSNTLMLAVGLKFYPMNFETVAAVAVPISGSAMTSSFVTVSSITDENDDDVVSMSLAGS